MPLAYVQRKIFSEDRGKEIFIRSHNNEKGLKIDNHYVALASLSALISYIKEELKISIIEECLPISYYHVEDFMQIDFQTVLNLELVLNNEDFTTNDSLVSLLVCKTIGGKRLLRHWVLQPLTKLSAIKENQNKIKCILENKAIWPQLDEILGSCHDIENDVGKFMTEFELNSGKFISKFIQSIIKLRIFLEKWVELKSILSSIKSSIVDGITSGQIQEILNDIDSILVKEKLQQFKVGSDISQYIIPSLSNAIENIQSQISQNNQKILSTISEFSKLNSNISEFIISNKGTYFTSPQSLKEVEASLKTPILSVLTKKHKSVYSTKQISELNEKNGDLKKYVELLIFQLIRDKVREIRLKHMHHVSKLANCFAEIDLMLSIAKFALDFEFYTFPKFSEEASYISIIDSIHPLLYHKDKKKPTPNDILFTSVSNLLIITGTNGSGKTTYLKQIALLCILAQIGSPVPAKKMCLSPIKKIFTRIGKYDSLQENLSTFAIELTEMNNAICSITPNDSLVLLDEVGDCTCQFEAQPLIHSIIEYFLTSGAFVAISTHNKSLPMLRKLYPTISNIHLETKVLEDKLTNTYQIKQGEETIENYSLLIATHIGIPKIITNYAYQIIKADINSAKKQQWREDDTMVIVSQILEALFENSIL